MTMTMMQPCLSENPSSEVDRHPRQLRAAYHRHRVATRPQEHQTITPLVAMQPGHWRQRKIAREVHLELSPPHRMHQKLVCAFEMLLDVNQNKNKLPKNGH